MNTFVFRVKELGGGKWQRYVRVVGLSWVWTNVSKDYWQNCREKLTLRVQVKIMANSCRVFCLGLHFGVMRKILVRHSHIQNIVLTPSVQFQYSELGEILHTFWWVHRITLSPKPLVFKGFLRGMLHIRLLLQGISEKYVRDPYCITAAKFQQERA